jgi:chromosome segregation ATPase
MNKLLERQLKKIFGDLERVPPHIEAFLGLVSETYDHAEEDRTMIERSLEISSRELGELNKKTREESEKLKENLAALERMNKLMVDRELKMIELKKEIASLKARSNRP